MANVASRFRLGAWLVAGTALTGVVAAQPAAWPASPDPLRTSSCPAQPWQLSRVEDGAWDAHFAAGYFNTWSGTWHTGTVHRARGRLGQPMQSDELRYIEDAFPEDAPHRFDLEGWEASLVVARGLGAGITLSARLVWLQIGSPNWDGITEAFHDAFHISQARRQWFPRGQSVIYVHDRESTLERLSGLDGSGPGDTAVALSGPAGTLLGAEHRWGVVIEPPTGARDTVRGSGGWDGGLRWRSTWNGSRGTLSVTTAYTWLDGRGSFLGASRSDTWHALASWERQLARRIWGRVAMRIDASPISAFTSGQAGRPALTYTLSLSRRSVAGSWLFLSVGENIPSVGVAPDYSLTVGWSRGHVDGRDATGSR